MESPSPQLVGQEFVRQYYTLLHERPKYLHRFYSSNSSYIHGGIVEGGGCSQEPAVGQSEIHKRIMALNFSECHTKIRQVDSQATVAGAVVVQVTGELSNNGSPMRRFMQTFVLAPQSPNKYYVHNDIFRYQDEVFTDDSDSGDEEPSIQDAVHAARPAAGGSQPPEQLPTVPRMDEPAQHQPLPAAAQQTTSVAAAGTESGQATDVRTGGEPPSLGSSKKDDPPPRPLGSSGGIAEAPSARVEPKQPKTWSNVIAQPSRTVAAPPAAVAVKAVEPQLVRADAAATAAAPAAGSAHDSTATKAVEQQPLPAGSSEQQEASPSPGLGAGSADGGGSQETRPAAADVRPRQYYPDSQQVFVGNLPPGTVDEDVKGLFVPALFDDSSEIISIKVITNPNSRTPYAFVVFSSATAVQRALEKKDYACKGQYINVEEKRPQQRYQRGMSNRYDSGGYYRPRGNSGGSFYSRGGGGGGMGRQMSAGTRRGGQQLPQTST